MRAAENHLKRVEILQGVEWKIAFAVWAAIGLGTSTALANMDKIASLLIKFQVYVVIAYLIIAAAYLLGFCRNNYNSLVTERNRYQHFQDLALRALDAPKGIRVSKNALPEAVESLTEQQKELGQLKGWDMLGSATWVVKAVSTHIAISLSYFSLTMSALSTSGEGAIAAIPASGPLLLLFSLCVYLFFYCCKAK